MSDPTSPADNPQMGSHVAMRGDLGGETRSRSKRWGREPGTFHSRAVMP